MNIRAKERGKAIRFSGDNYGELIDALGMESALHRKFGTSTRESLLQQYQRDARNTGNWALIVPPHDTTNTYRVAPGNYAVITNMGVFTFEPSDFNDLFEEDLTV